MAKKRAKGWYWVMIQGEWMVAQWSLGEFYICGVPVSVPEDQLQKIGERIPTPKTTK